MKEVLYECDQDDHIYLIKIGENARDNWDLIDISSQKDIWFHVSGHPSCHVVLCTDDVQKPNKSAIKYCAGLCKEGSKLKYNKSLKIMYTYIKNVRKADKPGSVHTSNMTIIKV